MIKRIISYLLVLSITICMASVSGAKGVLDITSGDETLITKSQTADSEQLETVNIERAQSQTQAKASATTSVADAKDQSTVTMLKPDDLIELKIDNTNPVNSNFLGLGGVYFGTAFLNDTLGADPYSDEQVAKEIENVKKSHAKIVRTYFVEDLPYNKDTHSFDWNSENIAGFFKFLDAMQEAGIDVALNLGYSLPSLNTTTFERPLTAVFKEMAQYYDGISNPTNDDCIPYYAQLYSELVTEIVERGYTCVKYGILFTEPDRPNDKETFDYWHRASRALHNALVEAGVRDTVDLIGPNTVVTCETKWVEWAVQEANDIIDIYSCHIYARNPSWDDCATTYAQQYNWCINLAEAVKETGKPFFIDETGVTHNDEEWKTGLSKSQYSDNDYNNQSINNPWSGMCDAANFIAILNSGASGMVYWSLVSEKYVNRTNTSDYNMTEGVQCVGLLPYLHSSGTPYYRYYAYQMIAESINHPDTKVYAVEPTNDLYATMTESANGCNSIIIVNNGLFDATLEIELAKSLGGKKVYKYVYDPNTIEPTNQVQSIMASGYYENVTDTITDVIPPDHVVVYTTMKHDS